MDQVKISVCMATYNGKRFITEQVDSILKQLSHDDEIIVVDDCSTDSTIQILESYNDLRIKIFRNNRNVGHVCSFGRAISLAGNEILILSDQDDIWSEGRLSKMVDALLLSGKSVLSSNSYFMDEHGLAIDYLVDPVKSEDSTRHLKNIIGIFLGGKSYFGCAMAFSRDIIPVVLPIPEYVESHDLWIVFAGNIIRSNIHLEDKTLFRRIHGNNASILKRPLALKIRSRFIFLRSIITIFFRSIRNHFKNLIS